jgi:hypothetical protein
LELVPSGRSGPRPRGSPQPIESMSVASSSPGCPPERLWPLFSAPPTPSCMLRSAPTQGYLMVPLTTCLRPSAQCMVPLPGMPNLPGTPVARRPFPARAVPTIVFHGDSDNTVNAQNGAAIVEQAIVGDADKPRLRANAKEGTAGGRPYSRTVYADADNQPVVEHGCCMEPVTRGPGVARVDPLPTSPGPTLRPRCPLLLFSTPCGHGLKGTRARHVLPGREALAVLTRARISRFRDTLYY